MKITYLDGLKFEVSQRNHKLIVDQPKPVSGDEGMTPPELLAASLGTCVGVYVMDYLLRNELPTKGVSFDVDMAKAENPNRIGYFRVQVHIPYALTDRQRTVLTRLARSCLVHNTLHHPPEVDIDLLEEPVA